MLKLTRHSGLRSDGRKLMTAPWCKALAMCRKRFARAFLGQESVEEGALVVLPLGEASEQPLRPSSTLENPREAPHQGPFSP